MDQVTYNTAMRKQRRVWFTGWSHNATPGSRTQFSNPATDTIKNGYAFFEDPEATEDVATLPSGMVIQGAGNERYAANVTKAATTNLGRFAGVVTGLPPEGLRPDKEVWEGGYKGGTYIDLVFDCRMIEAFILGDMSAAGFDTILGGVNGQWYLGIVALGTNGANLPLICAKPHVRSNVATAAKHPVRLGPLGNPTV
jgi:hypothetical protein